MKLLDLFPGLQGTVISSLILLPILLLMWLISIKLFKRRRKKSYLTLSIALLITLIDHAGSIWHGSMTADFWYFIKMEFLGQTVTALGACAFILLILGFYQLYHLTDRRIDWIFYGLCLVSCGTALLNSWLETVFIILFLFACLFVLGDRVGTDQKFRCAILSFLVTQGFQVWIIVQNHTASPWEAFLVKVLPVLSYSIMFFILLERVIEVMQKSYLSSITDALTGLFNRRHFYESLQKSVSLGQSVSVIFSDIDNFKKLNDTKGHKAGDDVLKQVANILKEEVDGKGLAGRYGGEEMVALIRDAGVDMKQLTERIRFRIEKETNPGVTASIGFSKWEAGLSHDELIKQADQAMYEAKQNGKNKVIRFATKK